ncbi:hypothetical protein StoSoilB3_42120 (plasmid) [Arthrobacter sp. StoSoilB3]|nr:hypothetical protein StoSoilB3_42120 [Arthrobacter sp. StoSoilB3]
MGASVEISIQQTRRGKLVDWAELRCGDAIEVVFRDRERDLGTVDCVGHDGALVWAQLQRAGHRVLLDQLDSTQIFYAQ